MIQRTKKRPCPHTFLRTQIRNVLRKWDQNQGNTVGCYSLSERLELRIMLEPKLRRLLAEDALAKQYREQKSLVT